MAAENQWDQRSSVLTTLINLCGTRLFQTQIPSFIFSSFLLLNALSYHQICSKLRHVCESISPVLIVGRSNQPTHPQSRADEVKPHLILQPVNSSERAALKIVKWRKHSVFIFQHFDLKNIQNVKSKGSEVLFNKKCVTQMLMFLVVLCDFIMMRRKKPMIMFINSSDCFHGDIINRWM